MVRKEENKIKEVKKIAIVSVAPISLSIFCNVRSKAHTVNRF